MNQNLYKAASLFLAIAMAVTALAGCSQREAGPLDGGSAAAVNSAAQGAPSEAGGSEPQAAVSSEAGSAGEEQPQPEAPDTGLMVRFGDEGEPFALHLYDNPTAAAIARHVGTADWRLPIYHYDDYDNWEVMQYYDIPSRYEIPSNPESVAVEGAGTVYYSHPNRIVLFYQDAQVSGEYTPVGYFDYTEEFLQAVVENPVLEGWGNKIVNISSGE